MDPKDRIVTFPRMGNEYTKLLENCFSSIGLNILLPPRTTDKTIQIGVRNTSEMFCYPIKPTLGNFAEALDNGANTLLMYDSMGQCRLKHYWKIQEFTLKKMGYEFEMCNLSPKNAISLLSRLSGSSKFKVVKEFLKFYHNIKEYDNEKLRWSEDMPNIGIVGEMFTCCDESINHGLEQKLYDLGVKPVNTVTLSGFLRASTVGKLPFFTSSKSKKHKIEAQKYFNGKLGGHGIENIASVLDLAERGIDGIIHILPMSCMPETTIEKYMDSICQDNKIPLLRIPIDENTADANLETRLETFAELIKIKRQDGE